LSCSSLSFSETKPGTVYSALSYASICDGFKFNCILITNAEIRDRCLIITKVRSILIVIASSSAIFVEIFGE
jgi:hypothetical protein